MRIRRGLIALVLLLAVGLCFLPAASADHGQGCGSAGCPMANKGGEEQYQCPITAKFFKKAHFMLDNKEELGLSEDQVKSIKALKLEVKKAYIQQSAGMQIWMADLDAKMSEEKLNVEEVNTLIDEGSASMSAGGKQTIAAYAKLKATLTADQMTKAKAIWGKKR